MAIGNSNKRLGLIGKDIDYSFSKKYFEEKFQKEGLHAYSYENFDLQNPSEIEGVLMQKDILGCNVTIPYKEAVLPYLDLLAPEAEAIGAVNTILFTADGKKIGHNTDAYGFETALKEQLSTWPKGALILGSGGASKAIKYVLTQHKVPFKVVSRKENQNTLSYSALEASHLEQYPLIINCTPLGTFPNTKSAPELPYHAMGQHNFLFDLVYNPSETTFMQQGKAQGAKAMNGLKMLIHQAEKAWELWRG